MPLVAAERLCAGYDGREVLTGVSLTVDTGERWAVIGKNGTGKSTFIKATAALIRPSAGRVSVRGRPVHDYSARARARLVAYVPQKPEACATTA